VISPSARLIASISAPKVLACALRNEALSFAKARSMGLRSGE
jgi:hypothetical protein